MSTKIKITESQLKMIFERRHTYAQENEEVFDEIDQIEDKDAEKIDVEGDQTEEWDPNKSVSVDGVASDAARRGTPPLWEGSQKVLDNFKRFL